MMAVFADVPVDLLSSVLEHLSKDDQCALARVSRAANKNVTPYLYSNIKLEATKSRSCARRLAFLLRSLLEHPQLAQHVTSFRLFGPYPCWKGYDPWPEDHRRRSPVNLWGLEGCATLSKAQIIFASNQFYQLVDENMHQSRSVAQSPELRKDALATLILTRCTELSTLELGDGFLTYSLFLPQILKRGDYLFRKLTHVVLGDKKFIPDKQVPYVNLDLIRPIFYSATVQKFEWTMTEPTQFRWNMREAPRSENLTTLHLFRTKITRSTLDLLLAATPHLKRFHFEQEVLFHETSFTQADLSSHLNLDGLNIALAHTKNTLEELILTLKLAPQSCSPADLQVSFPAIQGTLTVLKDMKNLKKVEVPMVMFLGWAPEFAARLEEVLPGSITELTLRDDFVTYCPWAVGFTCNRKVSRIGGYLQARETYANQLEVAKIRVNTVNTGPWLFDAVEELRAELRGKRGIQHWVVEKKRALRFCWAFNNKDDSSEEREDRKDSVIPVRESYIPGILPST